MRSGGRALVVRYRIFAFEQSVRTCRELGDRAAIASASVAVVTVARTGSGIPLVRRKR